MVNFSITSICNDDFWKKNAVMSITFQLHLMVYLNQIWCCFFFIKSMFQMIFIKWSKINTCIQPNDCHIKEWSALIYIYTINTIKLQYKWSCNIPKAFFCQLYQTLNWTVLTSTYIQISVFHCWERLHTVNMETNIY